MLRVFAGVDGWRGYPALRPARTSQCKRRRSTRNKVAYVLATATLLLAVTSTGQRVPVVAASAALFADIQISEMQDIVSDYRYRAVFGGLVGDESSHVITVYFAPAADGSVSAFGSAALSKVGTAADPKLHYGPKRWSVRYETRGPSLAVLDAVLSKIETAQPWRTDVGSQLVSYGIDPGRHAVVVGVEAITPTIAADSRSAFGDLVELQVTPRPRLASRQLDNLPYKGGDGLIDATATECTAGFAAWDPNSGNQLGMLTAGHCWHMGDSVSQGYIDRTGPPTVRINPLGPMGLVTRRAWANNVADAEFLNSNAVGSYVSPYVYTSDTASSPVVNYGSSWFGMGNGYLCINGIRTGEQCTGTVQGFQLCVWIDSGEPPPAPTQYRICHLAKVTAPTRLCYFGDSGGPVYTYGLSGLVAYGLISLFVFPAGTDCYYSEITQDMAELGVGLVTLSANLPPPNNLGDTLYADQTLSHDQFLASCNPTIQGQPCDNRYTLVMQGDGNLVLNWNGSPRWWSNTQGNTYAYAIMQGDGNLVIRNQGGTPIWSSGTYNYPGAWLVMQNDGNLVIYSGGTAIWWRP